MSWYIIGFALLVVSIKTITWFATPLSPMSLERVEEAYHAEMNQRFANLMQQLAPSLEGLPFAEGSEKFAEMVFIAKGFVLVTESDRAAVLAICEGDGAWEIETNADDEDPIIRRISLVGGKRADEARRVCELYRYADVMHENISEGCSKMLGMMLRRLCSEEGAWIIALIPNKQAEVSTIFLDGSEIQYRIFPNISAGYEAGEEFLVYAVRTLLKTLPAISVACAAEEEDGSEEELAEIPNRDSPKRDTRAPV